MAVEAHYLHVFPSQMIDNRGLINPKDNGGDINRTQMGFHFPAALDESSQDFYFQFQQQQQQLEIDQFVTHHAEKVKVELAVAQRRHLSSLYAVIEQGVAKKLKVKDEEIEKIKKMNWILEEKVKSLCIENQIWRDLAQTSETTANTLRTNLEHVLILARDGKHSKTEMEEDAESCCDSNEDDEKNKQFFANIRCRSCDKEESSVVFLPCRHLCLCKSCDILLSICPICKIHKRGSLHVILS